MIVGRANYSSPSSSLRRIKEREPRDFRRDCERLQREKDGKDAEYRNRIDRRYAFWYVLVVVV